MLVYGWQAGLGLVSPRQGGALAEAASLTPTHPVLNLRLGSRNLMGQEHHPAASWVGLLPGPAGNEGQVLPLDRHTCGPDPVGSTWLCVQTTPTPYTQATLGREGQAPRQSTLEAWPGSK